MDGIDLLHLARCDRGGFIRDNELDIIGSSDPSNPTRLFKVLVRCDGCRFTAGAQDALHLIRIIETRGSDRLRDVSIPAMTYLPWRHECSVNRRNVVLDWKECPACLERAPAIARPSCGHFIPAV